MSKGKNKQSSPTVGACAVKSLATVHAPLQNAPAPREASCQASEPESLPPSQRLRSGSSSPSRRGGYFWTAGFGGEGPRARPCLFLSTLFIFSGWLGRICVFLLIRLHWEEQNCCIRKEPRFFESSLLQKSPSLARLSYCQVRVCRQWRAPPSVRTLERGAFGGATSRKRGGISSAGFCGASLHKAFAFLQRRQTRVVRFTSWHFTSAYTPAQSAHWCSDSSESRFSKTRETHAPHGRRRRICEHSPTPAARGCGQRAEEVGWASRKRGVQRRIGRWPHRGAVFWR